MRYRYDTEHNTRLKTVELIEEQVPWTPKPVQNGPVFIKVRWDEQELREKVKANGGIWSASRKLWKLPYETVRTLKLTDRIMKHG